MSTRIDIPCSAVLLPTKGDLTNIFIQLANRPEQEIKDLLQEIDDLLGAFPISVSSPVFASLTIPEIEWEKRITALIQEYHLYVQVKILELIAEITPINFVVPIPGIGINIDLLKFFTDATYIITLKGQLVNQLNELYALIPDPYKVYDGEYGLVSDDFKLEALFSYIMSQLNKGALGLIHGAAGKLIELFDEIWSALGLPSLPALTSLDIETLIKNRIDSLRDELRDAPDNLKQDVREQIITSLESLSIPGTGFNLMDILGGTPNEFIISDERRMERFLEGLRDFGENWPKYLIQEWLNTVKKFLDAIGLGKILDWVMFDFCDFLSLIGLPKSIDLTNPLTITPVLNPGKTSLPILTRNTTPLVGDTGSSPDIYVFTRVKDQSTIQGVDNFGSVLSLEVAPNKVLIDGVSGVLDTDYTISGNSIILQNATEVNQNITIII